MLRLVANSPTEVLSQDLRLYRYVTINTAAADIIKSNPGDDLVGVGVKVGV